MALGAEPGRSEQSSARKSLREYTARVLVAVGLIAAIGMVLLLIWVSVRVWLLVFAGVLLAIFLRALSGPLTRYAKVPPVAAVALVVIMLLGLGALAGTLLAPRVAEQFTELSERLPKAINAVRERVRQYSWSRFLPNLQNSNSDLIAGTGQAISKAANVFTLTMDAVFGVLVVIFVGVYLAATPEPYVSRFIRLFPIAARNRVQEVLENLGTTLQHWLVGQVISMTVVGLLIGIGLKLLGVPLAFSLGLVAGLLDFVPIIGPLISAVPAVLLAFLISPQHALYVVLLYVVVNSVIESHLLVPLVQRLAVRLPPGVAIVAMLLGAKLFGFLGLLLATPAAAASMVLIRMVYVGDVLGDRTERRSP